MLMGVILDGDFNSGVAITICSIKRKENFFSLFFLAREQKNSGNKFFLFIEHEVLFYETPFYTVLEETRSLA
jgi:hypothetical protein